MSRTAHHREYRKRGHRHQHCWCWKFDEPVRPSARRVLQDTVAALRDETPCQREREAMAALDDCPVCHGTGDHGEDT